MSLSRQSTAPVLTTTNNYIHINTKRYTALANKINYNLIWYDFYYLRPGTWCSCGVSMFMTS